MPRPRKIELLPTSVLTQVESDWRAGLVTIKVMAAKYRVDADALRHFAARAGWTRNDLAEAIRIESTRVLIDRAVSDDQRAQGKDDPTVSTPKEVVRRYGQLAADVLGSHRDDAARGRLHASRLEHELYRAIAQAMASSSDPKEHLSLIRSAAETLRCLATSARIFIDIERQAWQLDKQKEDDATYEDFLAELHGETETP